MLEDVTWTCAAADVGQHSYVVIDRLTGATQLVEFIPQRELDTAATRIVARRLLRCAVGLATSQVERFAGKSGAFRNGPAAPSESLGRQFIDTMKRSFAMLNLLRIRHPFGCA